MWSCSSYPPPPSPTSEPLLHQFVLFHASCHSMQHDLVHTELQLHVLTSEAPLLMVGHLVPQDLVVCSQLWLVAKERALFVMNLIAV